MGFYQCPLLVMHTPLFRHKPEALMRPRISIAERARRLRGVMSRLDRNHVYFTAAAMGLPHADQSALAANFGSISKGKYIQIDREFEQEELEVLKVSFYDRPLYKLTAKERCHPFLEVNLRRMPFWEHIELSWLGSKRKGLGGKGLAAAYNAARDMGIKKIQFIVSQTNTEARRFYYHMDFGRPLPGMVSTWEVDVI